MLSAADEGVWEGINLFLGMTGQEEIQYRVFEKFGLNDTEIRSWFNGPALLTWSRGQNEYGSHIGGPLPRSWMKQQWNMMKQITTRYRSLGMSSQLPAFQGNAPVQLKAIHSDSNMTDNHVSANHAACRSFVANDGAVANRKIQPG